MTPPNQQLEIRMYFQMNFQSVFQNLAYYTYFHGASCMTENCDTFFYVTCSIKSVIERYNSSKEEQERLPNPESEIKVYGSLSVNMLVHYFPFIMTLMIELSNFQSFN